MENVKTASGAQLNNDLIQQVLAPSENKQEKATITSPSDNLVTLPAGYITPDGGVLKTAEVRELNGKDEEYISKAGSLAKALNTILNRAVVKVGDIVCDDKVLETMLAGDRDALLLGIYKATFGETTELITFCNGCSDFKTVEVDIDRDIKSQILVDAIEDRVFQVQGRKNSYTVSLPNGIVQRDMANNSDKTVAELTTLLFEHCIMEIDEMPVVSKLQVHNIGIADRRKISEEIAKRSPGPKLEDVVITCGDCEGEVVVPINFGTLFRF